jgi:hypothetical protein
MVNAYPQKKRVVVRVKTNRSHQYSCSIVINSVNCVERVGPKLAAKSVCLTIAPLIWLPIKPMMNQCDLEPKLQQA